MVMDQVADLVECYERHLASLDDEEYADFWDSEVLLALIARDVLEDRWAQLSPRCRRSVVELDEQLAAKHALVAREIPLPNPNVPDRSRWWWFLHEGPQVREQALAAASTAGEGPSN